MKQVSRKKAAAGLIASLIMLVGLMVACGPMYYTLDTGQPELPEQEFVRVPVPPVQPDVVLKTLEQVVDTPPRINSYKQSVPITKKSTIGVMDFSSSSVSGSGTLVADTFSINFFRKGLGVVERQNIKKITEEQHMAAKGMQRLTDEAIAKRIGKITSADFIVFGAVTQYHFENTKMPIPYTVDDTELSAYLKRIKGYKADAEKFEIQQGLNDEKFFRYMKDDLVRQIATQEVASLNRLSMSQGYNWTHSAAQNIAWQYAYFKTRKVLPMIGKRVKDLEFQMKSVDQDIEAMRADIQDSLKKYDQGTERRELWKMQRSYKKYYKSLKKIEEEQEKIKMGKTVKKPTQPYSDEYVVRLKNFARSLEAKLHEYMGLIAKRRAYAMRPIPEKLGQFEMPKDKSSFVSVANLGITFKVIDVRTGEIVWIGQASKRDLNIQKGLNEMVEAVVRDIVSGY